MKRLALLIPVLLLVGCGDEVSKVKDALVDTDRVYKNGSILDNRSVCQTIKWQAYKEDNNKFVKYTCLLKSDDLVRVYTEDGEKEAVINAKKGLTETLVKQQAEYFAALNNSADQLEEYVAYFDSLNTSQRAEIVQWKIGKLALVDTLTSYKETPEGGALFKELTLFNMGIGPRNPIALFTSKITATDAETQNVIKRILTDTVPVYITSVKASISQEEERSTEEINKKIEHEEKAATNIYRASYPLSRTETVIWTWNKLDERYERVDQYTEYLWQNEETEHKALCLGNVIYSVTHNVVKLDDYFRLSDDNGKCVF